jgi:hypothetical protein
MWANSPAGNAWFWQTRMMIMIGSTWDAHWVWDITGNKIIWRVRCIRSRKPRLRQWGIRRTDHATPLYPQKLELTSLTSGGHLVSIVRSRTKATEIVLVRCMGKQNDRYSVLQKVTESGPAIIHHQPTFIRNTNLCLYNITKKRSKVHFMNKPQKVEWCVHVVVWYEMNFMEESCTLLSLSVKYKN